MPGSYPKKSEKRRAGPESGAITVEFIFFLPLLLLVLSGIMELGNMWYVQHALDNASRAGARAGVVYTTSSTRNTWAEQQAVAAANNCLGQFLPTAEGTTISTSIQTDSNGVNWLTVSIQATNYLIILGKLIPAFASTKLEAAYTMRME